MVKNVDNINIINFQFWLVLQQEHTYLKSALPFLIHLECFHSCYCCPLSAYFNCYPFGFALPMSQPASQPFTQSLRSEPGQLKRVLAPRIGNDATQTAQLRDVDRYCHWLECKKWKVQCSNFFVCHSRNPNLLYQVRWKIMFHSEFTFSL